MTREEVQNWLPLIKAFIENRLQGKRKGGDNGLTGRLIIFVK